jgi:hypothetical protein
MSHIADFYGNPSSFGAKPVSETNDNFLMKRSFGAVDARNDRIGWRLHANRGNSRLSDRKDSEAEDSNMWSAKKLKMYGRLT